MKIVFMGTPEFAVASLKSLLDNGFDIAGVVTAPDKPAGRGQKVHESAVKRFAVENGLKILQPLKLKDPVFLSELRSLGANLQVVVAFRMLPEQVWNMPEFGTINLHASLLPQYRGAAPINWAIINGEKETGVSTFFLQQEIDTGNILFSEKVPIDESDTAGDLHDKLMHTGAALLVKTCQAISRGDYQAHSQEALLESQKDLQLRSAPKIFKEDCQIDWHKPVQEVYNFIRGLSPYPTAFTHLQEKSLKVFAGTMEKVSPQVSPGEYLSDHKNFLKFACLDGYISLEDVQLEGKKRLQIKEFLRGIRLS